MASEEEQKAATRCVWSSCCGLLACILYRRPVAAFIHVEPPTPAVAEPPPRRASDGDADQKLAFCACTCEEVTIGVRASAV